MNIKKICLFGLTLASLLGLNHESTGALPTDFPQLTILPNTNPAPGYLFGSVTVSNVPGKSNYFAILDNALNPILLSKTNSLGTLQCNGLFASSVGVKGAGFTYVLKDASFNVVATSQAGNGYMADNHDFEVLPNGHVLILIYDTTPVVDMSKLVPGGFPAAIPNQSVIQELDVDGNVVFQWRSLDHVPVTDSYQTLTGQNIGDYIHVNSLWFDDTDGNIILSCRNTSEVIKISRVTGDFIWRMQGKHNQFAFTNAIPGNTAPAYFQVQHNARRLPNGNITIYDNGFSQHSDPQYDFTRPYTRGVEYVIDEVNKTAKLVWAFRHDPDIINYNGAICQRLPGGHSIIQWGGYNGTYPWLAMSEADADGNLVADVVLQTNVTGNFTRMLWPLESTYLNVTKRELYAGDTYVFNQGTTNVTGVTLDVASLDADPYNALAVSRQPFAPVLPRFLTKAPRVVPVRVQMSQNLINAISAQVSFDVNSFGLKDPANTTVYYRQTPGQGIFVALLTDYNWVTGQLEAEMTGVGEFIFGFPDLAEVPYPPLLATPQTNAAVNQNLPVSFVWTPKGFAQEYYLQVSTNEDFSTLLVDQPGLTQALYTNVSVAAGTRYYWRVQTSNDGGESDWATNTFTTVPPMVQVTVPNGGERWQRGLRYIIQWNANITENVALDLYKGGVLVKTITTNAANIPAYSWQVSTTLVPGNDYSIKIRSTTDGALYDFSDGNFGIDVPVINAGAATRLPGGQVQFLFTAPNATQATLWGTSTLTPPNWQNLGPVTAAGGSGVFTTTLPYLFYRLSVP